MVDTETRKIAPDELALEALGNAVRRDILRLLAREPMSVTKIAAAFPISRPAISRHLAQLVSSGLVSFKSQGTRNYYQLSHEGFDQAHGWLNNFWDEAGARIKILAENIPETESFEDLTADLLDE